MLQDFICALVRLARQQLRNCGHWNERTQFGRSILPRCQEGTVRRNVVAHAQTTHEPGDVGLRHGRMTDLSQSIVDYQ